MPIQFIVNNWYLFLALAVVLALLIAGPVSQMMHGIKNLSPALAIQLVNREDGVVLDVCGAEEFRAGHIPQALNVPLPDLAKQLKGLEKYKHKPVVVSCRSGNRSVRGAILLRKAGFEKVYSLAGGIIAWQRDNLPVEK
jgi:rhodanese-related sulfurtransferase